MKIPKNVLKKMGYVADKGMFTAIVLTNYLYKKKDVAQTVALYIASEHYEVEKNKLTEWMVKLENAFDTIKQDNSTPTTPKPVPRSVQECSAKCTEWEQKMSELEAVVLA